MSAVSQQQFIKYREISEYQKLYVSNYLSDLRNHFDLMYHKQPQFWEQKKQDYLKAIQAIDEFEKSLKPADIQVESSIFLNTDINDPNVMVNGENIVAKLFNYKSIFVINNNNILIFEDVYIDPNKIIYTTENRIDISTCSVRDLQYKLAAQIHLHIPKERDFFVHTRKIKNTDKLYLCQSSPTNCGTEILIGFDKTTKVELSSRYNDGNIILGDINSTILKFLPNLQDVRITSDTYHSKWNHSNWSIDNNFLINNNHIKQFVCFGDLLKKGLPTFPDCVEKIFIDNNKDLRTINKRDLPKFLKIFCIANRRSSYGVSCYGKFFIDNVDSKEREPVVLNLQNDAFKALTLNKLTIVNYHFLKGIACLNKLFLPSSLRELRLCHCGIIKIGDDVFSQLVNLTQLYLDHNKITTIKKNTLANLKSLEIFSISNNNVQECCTGTFSSMPFLRHLKIDRNRLTEVMDIPTCLTHLILSCNLIKVIRKDIFQKSKTMLQIELSDNKIYDIDGLIIPNDCIRLSLAGNFIKQEDIVELRKKYSGNHMLDIYSDRQKISFC